MFKYISIRIIGITLIVLVTSLVYDTYFFEKDKAKHSDSIELVKKLNPKTQVLYLGESSNITTFGTDFDKRKISQFISDFYPDLVFDDITKPASHARIYHTLLENIPLKNSIETVIVTLNLRSFGYGWIESDLETALSKNMVLIEPGPHLYNRFRLGFKAYNNKTQANRSKAVKKEWKKPLISFKDEKKNISIKEWDKQIYKQGLLNEKGERDEARTALAAHFVKNFAFEIDINNNPRIQDFDNIVSLCKERGWNLVFNLLAENTDKAKELTGSDLIFLFESNRKLLEDYYSAQNVTVINNLNSVRDSLFIDKHWPTEHYMEKGRQEIAKNVALGLKTIYKDKFINHTYLNPDAIIAKTSHYENDFESNHNWSKGKLSEIEVFEGNYSNLIQKENPYSSTLQLPFYKLNQELKSVITVGFNLLVSDSNYDSKIIVEFHNQIGKPETLVHSIGNFNPKPSEWKRVSDKFEIPEKFHQAKLVKVFIYNPSKTNLYIDNVTIDFGE